MKIRNKLIMAFLIMIGLPVILITATAGTIFYYTITTVNNYYNVETTSTKILTNPNYFILDGTKSVYNEVKEMIKEDPERLLDRDYADSINQKFSKKSSFLVVSKDNQLVYAGDEKRFEQIQKQFPQMSLYNTQEDSGLYFDDNQPFLVRKTDFNYLNGQAGSVLVITNIEAFLPQVKKSLVSLIICVLATICFTAFFLVLWIYQGMICPLNILRNGIYRMKNGDLDFEIRADNDDEIGRICDDFEDMRQQVKSLMEERLEYEEQMKMLISNISHDLKTPITAIKGYSEGILDGVADTPEKLDKYLKIIYAKANDMTYLVDELSFYSKIDNNRIPYNFTRVNLNQYFTDCFDDLILDLELKQIELSYKNYVAKDAEVFVDVEQLKRVINNIVGNSVKYMDKEKGLIEVVVKEKADMVCVSFTDNGEGVPKEDLNRIFERFYRTDQSRNSSRAGSGLGLAIAKKIVKEHGGEIWADGKEGEGLSISFTLRIAKESEEAVYRVEKRHSAESKIKM
ncbi:HAMP domain-containing sensor histidine kinase [[Clostridium] polysaccharolyticum]|uniref:histidine kinase n=1 Tax=[Clostridium] polysaccharolyticum TaxID=29364 RepID=A0A1I0ESS8_9FIRM|nr:HAMP domain-containing sensor histidine kinase [[Clostridium] polysaccharolyticum]SET48298.1 HAMP domain-containing protein [[Clostridium] polysaccharolyticum]